MISTLYYDTSESNPEGESKQLKFGDWDLEYLDSPGDEICGLERKVVVGDMYLWGKARIPLVEHPKLSG